MTDTRPKLEVVDRLSDEELAAVIAADSRRALAEAEAAERSPLDLLRSRILSTSGLQALPPPAWIIDHLIPADALTLLYGPSGVGKSHVGIDIAAHVATGSWWHGRQVDGGLVLYIVAESPAGFAARLTAWQRHHGIAIDEYHGIDWLPVVVNLFDLGQAGVLRDLVRERRPRLLIVDTLARCAAGADENSAKDMGRIVEQVDLLRRASGCAAVLVHHTGKATENGARGSSALKAAVDTELEVSGGDGRITLKVTKQRNAPEALPIHLKLHPAADSVILLPARGDETQLPPGVTQTLDALVAVDVPGGVSSSAWRASADATDRTFYRHRTGLLADGLVVNIGTDSSPRYRASSVTGGPS